MNRLGWPMVAVISVCLAAMVALFALIPDSESESRTLLLTGVMSITSAITLWVIDRRGKETTQQVSEVQEKLTRVEGLVNGNTQRLIEKLPDPTEREIEGERFRQQLDDTE